MKTLIKLILISLICFSPETLYGSDKLEADNYVSSDFIDIVQKLPVVREINGGTVFVVKYGDNCSYQMRGAFEYACKILEEYMPPCLPINVYVEWGSFRRNSSNSVISKVSTNSMEGFGDNGQEYYTSPLPKIKNILLNEYIIGSHASFINCIPNVDFLNNWNEPDIYIIFNEDLKDEFNYSIDEEQTSKYDFVSVVLRDLIRGLGLYNSFERNPKYPNQLMNPSSLFTDFEKVTSSALGEGDAESRFANATSGQVDLLNDFWSYLNLKLYAPTDWDDNKSLNYFIPSSNCAISNIMSYEFGKGTIRRNINDRYSSIIFRELYGWRENFVSGSSISSTFSEGSTQNYVQYKGTLNISENLKTIQTSNIPRYKPMSFNDNYDEEIYNYLLKFHPGINNNYEKSPYLCTLAILKKDGQWDIVHEQIAAAPELINDIDTSDLNLNYDINDYARTCDGYLRARLSYSYPPQGVMVYKSYFYVLDYLPQKIEIEEINESSIASLNINESNATSRNIKLGLKNLEGLNKVIIEVYINNNRFPFKYTVTDFKKGYFETSISNSLPTRLVAVGYNNNGSSRSEALEFTPTTSTPNITINIKDDHLDIDAPDFQHLINHIFEIHSLTMNNTPVMRGLISEPSINISNLNSGLYLLKIIDGNEIINLKFQK